jgi:hypothetical protein
MRSHNYEFQARDVARLVVPTLVPLALFAGVMHFGAVAGLLPKPRPTLDVDRTILVHKAETSGFRQDAEVLLIGDSSCLIDVDGRQLTQELGASVLNLGTLSYLGLDAHGALLRRFFVSNPGRAKTVVLLMHPEALRLLSSGEYHASFLHHFLNGQDLLPTPTLRDRISHALGFETLRGRILARLLPIPLGGAYGRHYGFSSDLEAYLRAHRGSAVDPEPKRFQGNPEYRLAPQFEHTSRAFRSAIPAGVKLLVGITPLPASFAPPDYPATRDAILNQWQQWLHPDLVLTNLPLTLPDHLFVKTTHLSREGTRRYTEDLAKLLRGL